MSHRSSFDKPFGCAQDDLRMTGMLVRHKEPQGLPQPPPPRVPPARADGHQRR